jgi:hypothetical protein
MKRGEGREIGSGSEDKRKQARGSPYVARRRGTEEL